MSLNMMFGLVSGTEELYLVEYIFLKSDQLVTKMDDDYKKFGVV